MQIRKTTRMQEHKTIPDLYTTENRIRIVRYEQAHKELWDTFVHESKNGTFLFLRDYMDYHNDRFTDCSLLFLRNGKILALLPANINEETGTLHSHSGLTYGGLVMSKETRCAEVLEIFKELKRFMREELNSKTLHYKPLPHIYCRLPAEEPLYALFRMGAMTTARSVSTTIDNSNRTKPSQQRIRGAKKANEAGITCTRSTRYGKFWKILTETLRTRHNCTPVHTLEEIELLSGRFPENIKLFTAGKPDGTVVAGVVVYETDKVAHLQYIAASPEGKECGALDALVFHLIEEIYPGKAYIDFGISTEEGGTILNEGLISQKEGFGGRAVVYDTYEMKTE